MAAKKKIATTRTQTIKKNSKNKDGINNLGKDIIILNGKLSIRETIYLIQNSICFIELIKIH